MTRRRILVFLLTVVILLTGASPAPAGTHDLQPILDQFTKSQAATATIAEFRDGRTVWRGSSGVTTIGGSKPASPDGRFRIGSVTKTFVATVVLQLVAERRVGLDDTLDQRLPGLVPRSDRITVRHLLQHTSGIENYARFLHPSLEDFLANRFRTYQPQELIAVATSKPPLFEPGTSWSYSNTNYIVLGLLIERLTGKRLETVVSQRILRPLGLRDTVVPGTDPFIRGPFAHTYVPIERNGQIHPVDITVFSPSAPWTAGGMISTTADLNRFFDALLSGRLLPKAQLREMMGNPVGPNQYGLGIGRVVLPCGVTVWGHDGGFAGYLTLAFSTEDTRTKLTVSFSLWTGNPGDALAELLMTAFCGPGTQHGTVQLPEFFRQADQWSRGA